MDELLAPIQDAIEGQIVRPATPSLFIVIAPRGRSKLTRSR